MLTLPDFTPAAPLARTARDGRDSPLRLAEDLVRRLRRHWKAVVLAYGLAFAAAVGLVMQSVPQYTATVAVLIDARKVGLASLNSLEGALSLDTGAIDSQVQLIQSDVIATQVARRLDLADNPGFLEPPRSGLARAVDRLVALVVGRPEPVMRLPEPLRLEIASRILQNSVEVKRVGRTYVISVSVTLPGPEAAMTVAGAFADVYLSDQLESKFDAARRATAWLDERLRDLRAQAIAADDAVQRYRTENGLSFNAGQLVSEQALAQINQQLSTARGSLADAEARYARLSKLVDDREVTGAVAEANANPVVADLRTKYLAATKRLSELENRLAPGHERIIATRAELRQYEALIFSELDRSRLGARSEMEIARDRVQRLEAEASVQGAGAAVDNKALAKLNTLMQEASTYNALYSAYLQRYQETAQQESFPVGDARIISPPTVPPGPSSPNAVRALLAAFLVGTIAATLSLALLDFRDRGYRTREQIRDDLGVSLLSYLPDLPYRRRRFRRSPTIEPGVLDVTLSQPFSRFAEGVRAVQIALDRRRKPGEALVVGVVSVLPGEGKSSVSKNLASFLARTGGSVLLLDGDSRNPTLTAHFSGRPRDLEIRPVLDIPAAAGEEAPRVAGLETRSGLAFVGAPRRRRGEIEADRDLSAVVAAGKARYGTVVIDFPPLALIHDAAAHAGEVDVFVLVVEWGMTPRRIVREVLDHAPDIAAKLEGAVLNKCSLKTLSLYGTTTEDYLFTRKAGAYYEAAS